MGEDVTDRLGRVIGHGEHVHDWRSAGVTGVYERDGYNAGPKYVALSNATTRIAMLMQCGCGAVGMTVLDQRHLLKACDASAGQEAGSVVVG